MEIDLTGRTAMITGASKGLGLAMAARFAASGADVALLARRPEVLEEAKAAVGASAKGKVAVFPCDVSKAADIERAYKGVTEVFGKVDILVNNAGESKAMPFATITDEIWQADLDLKLFGHPHLSPCTRRHENAALGPHHQRAQHRRQGTARGRRADRGVARRRHGAHQDTRGR